MAEAATKAKKLLEALGVERIVVIDDAVPDPRWFAVVALLEGRDRAEVGSEADFDLLRDDWRDRARQLGTADQRAIGKLVYARAKELGLPFPQSEVDAELAALSELFSSNPPVQLTPEQWTLEGEDHLALAADQRTLFFIDQDLGENRRGVDLVKRHLVDPPPGSAFCMLTSEATPDNEFAYWRTTCEAAGISPAQLGVTAKAHLTDDQMAFVRMLKMSFTAGQVETVRDRLIERARDAFSASIEDLVRIEIPVLTSMVFESSGLEGVWEVETIQRILMAFTRHSLDHQVLADGEFAEAVRAISAAATVPLGSDERLTEAARIVQHHERYMPGELLAATRMAIANGDIFEVPSADGESEYWMLAVQPCDIALRNSGKRNLASDQVAVLPLKPLQTPPRGSAVQLPFHDPESDAKWFALLTNASHVPVEILDLAAFSADGVSRWSSTSDFADVNVVGWAKRADRVAGRIRSLIENDRSTDVETAWLWAKAMLPRSEVPKLEPAREDDAITYPVRRVRRLRERHAETVLLAYGLAQSRTAEAHDLAKIRDS